MTELLYQTDSYLREFDGICASHTSATGMGTVSAAARLGSLISPVAGGLLLSGNLGQALTVFAAAFADVSSHFAQLFTSLFPGGTGKLVLTNPDDLLNTGIEVEAKPSGKNVKKLSLLSGGERSLTALGFLFAVFRSRPSPFYVMDEVEAALDEPNLYRFLALIQEFRQDAQLLIVSHQKRTMEAGDSLLGVSMQPGGSSKVIVEKVSSSA